VLLTTLHFMHGRMLPCRSSHPKQSRGPLNGSGTCDLIANYIVSVKGFPKIAVSAVYSGPVLNTYVGLGLSVLVGWVHRPHTHTNLLHRDTNLHCILPPIACSKQRTCPPRLFPRDERMLED
jgi:hypothetical protein